MAAEVKGLSKTMHVALDAAVRGRGRLHYIQGGWGAHDDPPDPKFSLLTVKALERRGLVEFDGKHAAHLVADGWLAAMGLE